MLMLHPVFSSIALLPCFSLDIFSKIRCWDRNRMVSCGYWFRECQDCSELIVDVICETDFWLKNILSHLDIEQVLYHVIFFIHLHKSVAVWIRWYFFHGIPLWSTCPPYPKSSQCSKKLLKRQVRVVPDLLLVISPDMAQRPRTEPGYTCFLSSLSLLSSPPSLFHS